MDWDLDKGEILKTSKNEFDWLKTALKIEYTPTSRTVVKIEYTQTIIILVYWVK